MPIRPIDVQNIIARLDTMSHQISTLKASEEANKEIQKKKQHDIALQKKEGFSKVNKIEPEENLLIKINDFLERHKEDRRHKDNKFKKDDDDHLFEKKV